jgi:hypothetical protein
VSDDRQPWWASADAGQSTTDDPIAAHRAARRGASTPDGTSTTANDPSSTANDPSPTANGSSSGRGTTGEGNPAASAAGARGAAGDRRSGTTEPPHGHAEAICGVCPICVLARTLGDSHPELLGHLTEAARHLAAAARAMLDPSTPDEPGTDGVERIDLD